ncbi:AbrB family transcriptional regulator [Nioella nitratireducens]|uniref:AbrB family transcriptional regulator n=1 Tax=Nioella nitratireducens TaxID=1287720 RepID=UPI0008FD5535|nr:AbrB family transcriptional regulator [Nioella nitratireducens]
MTRWFPPDLPSVLLTLALGGAGAATAMALHIPAPFLTGPAAVVSFASVFGLSTRIPLGLRDLCFLVIGLSMGTGINPEILSAAAAWPMSLVALAAALVFIFLGGAEALQRWLGLDRITARLAASPGHLSYILSLSTETRADVALLAVVQSLRVLTLTLLVPLVVALVTNADLSMSSRPGTPMDLLPLAGLAVVSAGLGLVFKRLKLPAAFLMGGLVLSAVSHGTGVLAGIVPVWLAVPSFVIMGTLIGTRFSGVTWSMIVRALAAALILTGFALVATVAAAVVMHWALGIPLTSLLIAYAPGGLETMAAISVMLDADPAFVAFHHAFRVLMLTFLVPAFLPRTEPQT